MPRSRAQLAWQASVPMGNGRFRGAWVGTDGDGVTCRERHHVLDETLRSTRNDSATVPRARRKAAASAGRAHPERHRSMTVVELRRSLTSGAEVHEESRMVGRGLDGVLETGPLIGAIPRSNEVVVS